jgi:hypothetical protein
LDSHPPGGFLSLFKNTPSHPQAVGNGTSSQPINVGDDMSGVDCERTEKRLQWTKEEDLRLVSYLCAYYICYITSATIIPSSNIVGRCLVE